MELFLDLAPGHHNALSRSFVGHDAMLEPLQVAHDLVVDVVHLDHDQKDRIDEDKGDAKDCEPLVSLLLGNVAIVDSRR